MSKTGRVSQRPAGQLWPSQGKGRSLAGSFVGSTPSGSGASTSQGPRPPEGVVTQCHGDWRRAQHRASSWGHERTPSFRGGDCAHPLVPLLALLAAGALHFLRGAMRPQNFK